MDTGFPALILEPESQGVLIDQDLKNDNDPANNLSMSELETSQCET